MLAGMTQQIMDQGPGWIEISTVAIGAIGVLLTGVTIWIKYRRRNN
jgi:LPXTG-motif cell wall-anchored protein